RPRCRRRPRPDYLPRYHHGARGPDLGREPPRRGCRLSVYSTPRRPASDPAERRGRRRVTDTGPSILVIEAEPQMRRFLPSALEGHGYRVVEVGTAREGLAQAAGRNPDVILLDLGLPDGDGLDVTRRLREWSASPIIVLSARGLEQDKVRALDAGADDYLTKPFGVGELLARIRVALRHASAPPGELADPVFTQGELSVDLARRQVFVGDREV